MDCECCRQKKAHIRVCDVAGNNIEAVATVCPDCFKLIQQFMFDIARPLLPTTEVINQVQMLLGDGKALAVPPAPGMLAPVAKPEAEAPTCPDCGMTLGEFKAKGRFGCPRDYDLFSEYLDPVFERIHDVQPARHRGRLPHRGDSGIVARRRRASELRELLENAVAGEEFEEAARLRDELQELESDTQKEGSA